MESGRVLYTFIHMSIKTCASCSLDTSTDITEAMHYGKLCVYDMAKLHLPYAFVCVILQGNSENKAKGKPSTAKLKLQHIYTHLFGVRELKVPCGVFLAISSFGDQCF